MKDLGVRFEKNRALSTDDITVQVSVPAAICLSHKFI